MNSNFNFSKKSAFFPGIHFRLLERYLSLGFHTLLILEHWNVLRNTKHTADMIWESKIFDSSSNQNLSTYSSLINFCTSTPCFLASAAINS